MPGSMRELIYISLLTGFCSGLAAALDRGLLALLFAAVSTFTAYAAELSTRCCSAAESRKLQKVRHRPAEWASITSPMPLLLSSEIHRRAHEIALAELDPAMAQDVIRRCAVEIEVR